MIYGGLFLVELLLLFLVSRVLSRRISAGIFKLTGNIKSAVFTLAVLFLPGTFLHEMAHLIAATALFVKAGKLNLMPEVESEKSVKMGSIQIEQTDLIRSLIIGSAPLILGIAVIFISLSLNISAILKGYIVFEVGNTMFSSRKDMEGGLKILIFLIFLLSFFYLLGFRLEISSFSSAEVNAFLTGDKYLAIPLAIDLGLVFLLGRFV